MAGEITIFVTKIIPVIVNKVLQIDNILVGKEIAKTKFVCDLKKCKGACCTLDSEFGAPLMDEELELIDGVLDKVKDYLPENHRQEIEAKGFYERKDNQLMTRSFSSKACVFVYYENEIAKCGIEKAFLDGKTDFKKPISCHLFPIRISEFGGEVLRFEKFSECSPALDKGKEEGINLVDFLKDSLIKKYGINWYLKLKEITDSENVIT
ncbi:MAG TPA: DUF3109 family protein [Ignavibacteriaceae bacterium]|nr:DUF3109 family protein [Ignavibacteriaceae bacterium]